HGVTGGERAQWHPDFRGTGSGVLLLGDRESNKRVWLMAHVDQISYLVEPGDAGRYPLLPLCYHMQQDPRRAAIALAPDLDAGGLRIAARGEIVVDGPSVVFETLDGRPLAPGMRVVYDTPLTWDRLSGRIQGYLDDSVCCTAMLLAVQVLRWYPVDVLVALTDEEEGPPGDATQSFCKGGRRLVRHFAPPDLAIVSDVHESEAMMHGPGPRGLFPGDGAVFAERSSHGRGTATPPPIYAFQRSMADAFGARGTRLRENWGGYVSRSEDVNASVLTPNVALLGILCSNRHLAHGEPQANLNDILDLARALVGYVLLVHGSLWQDLVVRRRLAP
ncbi:MAG: hypothetical protein ACKOWF_01080, partial [Chloroflexota bacterium]